MKKIFLCVSVMLFCSNVQGMLIKQLQNGIKRKQPEMRELDKKCSEIRNQQKRRVKKLTTLDKKIKKLDEEIKSAQRNNPKIMKIVLLSAQVDNLGKGHKEHIYHKDSDSYIRIEGSVCSIM